MASVKLETTAQGRGCHDWDYVPLSDEHVVTAMVKNRTKLDSAYEASLFVGDSMMVSGANIFKEPVMCSYIDLDRIIKITKLSAGERMVLNLTMMGWNIGDIAEYYNKKRGAIDRTLRRAIQKIVKTNNALWEGHYGKSDK